MNKTELFDRMLEHFSLNWNSEDVAWCYRDGHDMDQIDEHLNLCMRAEKYDSGKYARLAIGNYKDCMWE